ncbi:MAG: packaged DNA stabilization protein [Pseudomonadota bacterium]
MVQVPIMSGISVKGTDFKSDFPVNLIPVPKAQGISEGYLRPAEGIVTIADGGQVNRGGTRWRDEHYRVAGVNLIKISESGAVGIIGAIGETGGADWATFAQSFDHLAINAGGKIFMYDGTTLTQVTDPDLGVSLDVEWANGYFISTDGANLISSDINNPFSYNLLRYAASEINPDPVVALMRLRSEIYAVNRYTIEVFAALTNPGLLFPFARVDGAQIMKGAVGSRACCEFMESLAFVGSGDNQPPAVWAGSAGSVAKLSTRDIDDVLKELTLAELQGVVMESRADRNHEFLYVHLPNQTLVYDGMASAALQQPVWFVLKSGDGGYRARGMVWCYNQWNVADPFGSLIGRYSDAVGAHYGDLTTWQFSTPVIYGEGRGVQVHEIELVALSGDIAGGDDPVIGTSYSIDGVVWSQPKYIKAGRVGERNKRLTWDKQGEFRNWRVQRFTGDSRAHLAFVRLEAKMEALAW